MAQTFSNTSSKHADPFKEANLDREVPLAQKIGDLSEFISNCKFGMMTTRDANKSGNLVSRCMALVAKASFSPSSKETDILLTRRQETGGVDLLFHTNSESGKTDVSQNLFSKMQLYLKN